MSHLTSKLVHKTENYIFICFSIDLDKGKSTQQGDEFQFSYISVISVQ